MKSSNNVLVTTEEIGIHLVENGYTVLFDMNNRISRVYDSEMDELTGVGLWELIDNTQLEILSIEIGVPKESIVIEESQRCPQGVIVYFA